LRAILENVESEDSTLSAVTNNPHVTHEMLYEILENPAAFAFRDEVQAKIRSMRGQHHMQDTAASAARRRLIGEHQTTFRAPQLLPPSARRRQLADRGALRRSTEATSATRREHEASSSHQPPAAEAYETLAGSRGRGSNVYRSASNSRRTNLSSDRPAPSTSLGNHFGGTESGHRPTPSQRALGRLGGGEKGEDTQRGNSHRRKR
jgi:hypothetical protein